MLANLLFRGGAESRAAALPQQPATTPAPQPHSHSDVLLGDLDEKVELREVSGSLDRHLANGPLSIVSAPSAARVHANGDGNGSVPAPVLRVGKAEVPLGHGQGVLSCQRLDSRTLRIAAPGSGGAQYLLVFPRGASDHDVARTEAVLQDLAAGRGTPAAAAAALEPAGPPPGLSARGAQEPADVSRTVSTGGNRVLYHDAAPVKALGWKRDHPVRLTHLERLPPLVNSPSTPPSARSTGGGGSGGSGNGKADAAADWDSLGRQQGLALGRVYGTVAVANLAFEKDVRARYSLDGWKTYGEVVANWDKRLGVGADNFNFLLDLDEAAATCGVHVRETLAAGRHVTLSLAVHYTVRGKAHWDNNDGSNYTFHLALDD